MRMRPLVEVGFRAVDEDREGGPHRVAREQCRPLPAVELVGEPVDQSVEVAARDGKGWWLKRDPTGW